MRVLPLLLVTAVVAALAGTTARAAEAPIAEIVTARLDGGDARSLSAVDARGAVRGPGRSMFFVSAGDDGRGAFFVMNEDGSGRRQLGARPGDGYWGPVWSPDGRTVAITRWDESPCTPTSRNCATSLLVLLDAETGAERLVLRPRDRGVGELSWAPNGSQLALAGELDMDLGARTVETIRPDGSGRRVLVRLAPGAFPGIYNVTWSPRGDRIAYDRGGWIYLVRPQGGPSTKLVRGHRPMWSPNGQRLLFTSRRDDSVGIVDVATRRTRVLGNVAELWHPTWSPDSRRVAFVFRVRNSGISNVAVVRVSDGRRLHTWQPGAAVNSLFFSRDGSRLVYARLATA